MCGRRRSGSDAGPGATAEQIAWAKEEVKKKKGCKK